MLSRSLREWYLKQQAILKLLPPGKNRMKRRGLRKALCCLGKGSAFRVVVIKVRIIDVVIAVVLLLLSIGCID